MGQVRVFAVDQTMQYASSVNAKSRMTKFIRKGKHWRTDWTDKVLNRLPDM